MSWRPTLLVVGALCASACVAEHVATGKTAGTQLKASAGVPPAGFLSTSNAEQRKELHEVISASVGTVVANRRDAAHVKASLMPMWQALVKNTQSRIDHRSLRYIVHRYMLKSHSVSIVGLEPAKNQTDEAMFLKTHAPLLVKESLEGANAAAGFSLDDVVAMIFMMEHFVMMSAEPHLEEVFKVQQVSEDSPLNEEQFLKVMQRRFFEFMLSGNEDGISSLRTNMGLAKEYFEDYADLDFYVKGSIEAHRSGRHSTSSSGLPSPRNPLTTTFTFNDALEVAGAMSLSVGRYWETECARMKSLLSVMDKTSSGRVRLADFHHAALNGEWRFSESKEYLRYTGALDETSSRLGPRVIITNYVQGASNCIVSTPQFRVCCANECESYLSDIEAAIQAPAAGPELILAAVSKMTTYDDDAVAVPRAMRAQLFDIAQVHNGVVPIHGRLFAQWLHYLFPLDCPYPHKSGSMGSMSFFEFGEEGLASTSEIRQNAASASKQEEQGAKDSAQAVNEEDWLAQWSHEEELVSSHRYRAPWDASSVVSAMCCMMALAACSAVAWVARSQVAGAAATKGWPSSWAPAETHAHII